MDSHTMSVLVILDISFWRVVLWLVNHTIDLPSLQSIVLYKAFVGVDDYSVSSMIESLQ